MLVTFVAVRRDEQQGGVCGGGSGVVAPRVDARILPTSWER